MIWQPPKFFSVGGADAGPAGTPPARPRALVPRACRPTYVPTSHPTNRAPRGGRDKTFDGFQHALPPAHLRARTGVVGKQLRRSRPASLDEWFQHSVPYSRLGGEFHAGGVKRGLRELWLARTYRH